MFSIILIQFNVYLKRLSGSSAHLTILNILVRSIRYGRETEKEVRFEYVCEMDGCKLFWKRK